MLTQVEIPEPLTPKYPVHDHGYIQVIEKWGSDERIVEAARMSTDKGFLGYGQIEHHWQCPNVGEKLKRDKPCPECDAVIGDEGLLKYLMNNNHSSPFEMAGLVIEIQAPIMVFREWHRHRTQSYNELSARYTPLPDFNYMPTVERCMEVNTANRQANAVAGAEELTHEKVLGWLEALDYVYKEAQACYEHGLRIGIPKELARLPVPVGRYSRMRASANLRNWLGFATLRSTAKGPNAQREIRDYTDVLCNVGIQPFFPRTWELFMGKA